MPAANSMESQDSVENSGPAIEPTEAGFAEWRHDQPQTKERENIAAEHKQPVEIADRPALDAGENSLRGVRRHQHANHEYQDENGRDTEYRIVQVHPETLQIVLPNPIVCSITLWHGLVPQFR
jgi:hypothetical protein